MTTIRAVLMCYRLRLSHTLMLLGLLILFGSSNIFAQQAHGKKSNSAYERFQKPQVKYQLQAEVLPAEGLIRGWLDINWTNFSDDTIRSICLDFGHSPYPDSSQFDFYAITYDSIQKVQLTKDKASYCWLDSVLFQAARLNEPARMKGQSLIEIPLPVPIYPGKAGPLMISFETKFRSDNDKTPLDSLWSVIPEWFPQVAHYHQGHWRSTSELEATDDHPMASYAVSIKIDSAFSIIGSGELLNNKEHYGTPPIPEGENVSVDVTGFLYAFNPDNPYHPKFEDGKKNYYFSLLNGNNFPMVLVSNFKKDIAIADNQLIEIIYPPEVSEYWRERVATQARIVLLALSEKLGHYPFPILKVIALPGEEQSYGFRELIGLAGQIGGNSDIRKALTNLIARSWLADFINSNDADSVLPGFSVFDEALASILAEDAGTGLTGSGMIGSAETFSNTVSSWKFSTPYKIENIKRKFGDLVLVAGQKKFMKFVTELSKSYQFRSMTEKDFITLLNSTCGEKSLELLKSKKKPKALNLHRFKSDNK